MRVTHVACGNNHSLAVADGRVFEGGWAEGKKQGPGAYTMADGRVELGSFGNAVASAVYGVLKAAFFTEQQVATIQLNHWRMPTKYLMTE